MEQELERYITETKEYGKPSDDAINHFINSTLASIIIDKPKRLDNKTIETNTNSKWLELVRNEDVDIRSTAPLFSGGYDFYYYLSKQDIKDEQSLRIAIEQYTIPELPRINDSLRDILKQYNGVQIYQVSHVDGTYHYLVVQNNGDIKTYNENGKQLSSTNDIELLAHLKSISFKQRYLGTDINAFLNIPLNNVSELDLYVRCDSIENLSTITNQHNIIDNVAHANMADTSMVSGDSLESDKAKQAERSYEAHNSTTANIADDLTDEATKKVVDTFTNVLLHGDENGTLKKLADETYKIQKEHEEKEQWIYKPVEYKHKYNTKDLYSKKVLDDAKNNLHDHHVTAIIGHTGDGKTQLAYLLAHSLTEEQINSNDEGNHRRICVCNASQVGRIYTATGEEKPYILNRFIKYIKDNNIKEKCVFICNEIQRVDIASLLGGLFDKFTDNSKSFFKEVPNLYLIFTGCIDSDFGIDDQSVQRLHRVNIGYISKNNTDRHNKIIEEYANYTSIEKTLELVEKINDTEEYPVISMRLFKRLLNKDNIVNDVNEDTLSNDSKKAWDKLKVMYGINS